MSNFPLPLDISIIKGRGRQLSVADFGLSAGDSSLASVHVLAPPSTGVLLYDADGLGGADPVAVTGDMVVSVADIVAGRLSFAQNDVTGTARLQFSVNYVDATTSSIFTLPISVVAQGALTTKTQSISADQHITIPNAGVLSVADTAVKWSAASTSAAIDNSGIIESTAVDGRAINASGALTGPRFLTLANHAGGIIQSQDDAFRINIDFSQGMVKVDNAGLILSSKSGQAIDFDAVVSTAGGQISINNAATGVIRAMGADAIRPGQNATVTNAGIVDAAGGDGKSDGVDFQNNQGTVINQAGGLISGQRHGITTSTYVSVVNAADAEIIGRNGSGVGSDGGAKVENHGIIIGAYAGSGNGDGDGIDIDGYGEVDNWGVVNATGAGGVDSEGSANASDGIVISGGGYVYNHLGASIESAFLGVISDNLTNEGSIRAVYGVSSFGSVANYGQITGSTVAIQLGGHAELTNYAGASITGTFNLSQNSIGVKADSDSGILIDNKGSIFGRLGVLFQNGNNVLYNSGSISGIDAAIVMTTGHNRLVVETGSSIKGSVIGGNGAVIELADGASFAKSTGFTTLYVDGDGTLTSTNDFATIQFASNSVLHLAKGATLGTAVLDFGAGPATLELAAGETLPDTVERIGSDDKIILSGVGFEGSALSVESSQVLVTDATGHSTALNVSVDPDLHLVMSSDGNGHVQLSAVANVVTTSPVVPAVVFALTGDVSASEAAGAQLFTVTRTGSGAGAATIFYTVTGDGTHPADAADFGGTLPSGTVTFVDGETSHTISVPISEDHLIESDETFTVTIADPIGGGSIDVATATGTIVNDDHFDPAVYLASYADLRLAFGTNLSGATSHWLRHGIAEGRDPNLFDAASYAAAHPEAVAAVGTGTSALANYFIEHPAGFDPAVYLASYADLRLAFGDDLAAATEHWLNAGIKENRDPNLFDATSYAAAHPEAVAAVGSSASALASYFIEHPTGFDPAIYLASYADLRLAFGPDLAAATEHWLNHGVLEGRDPNLFDSTTYAAAHPEAVAAVGTSASALATYSIVYSYNPTFNALEYAATNPDVARAHGDDQLQLLNDYMSVGISGNRSITGFDAVAYLLSSPTLEAEGAGVDGALHEWVKNGVNTGAVGDSLFGREQSSHDLTIGTSVSAAFEQAGDHDWFKLHLDAGTNIDFDVTAAGSTELKLFDSVGHLLTTSTGGHIDYAATMSDSYYITASAQSDQSGFSYTIETSFHHLG